MRCCICIFSSSFAAIISSSVSTGNLSSGSGVVVGSSIRVRSDSSGCCGVVDDVVGNGWRTRSDSSGVNGVVDAVVVVTVVDVIRVDDVVVGVVVVVVVDVVEDVGDMWKLSCGGFLPGPILGRADPFPPDHDGLL